MRFNDEGADAVSQARNKARLAITEFVQALHDARVESPNVTNFDQGDAGQVYILGFAAEVEYVVPGWVTQEMTGNMQLIPEYQSFAYTRGLFERGVDTYRK